jgi:mRNA-degrading endonuclease RelE of RelBE toxin-antitoxin system
MWAIVLAPEAVADLRRLSARHRSTVQAALEAYLRHEPTRVSRSRIKRLRGLARPHYRLRVEELRIFYDVVEAEATVEVLAIVPKSRAAGWLTAVGEEEP